MSRVILVATHRSTAADHVVRRAIGLATATGASLHAVSVVQNQSVGAPVGDAGAEALASAAWEAETAATIALTRAAEAARAAGVDVTEHLVHGDPAMQIAVVADAVEADIVVIGSRGLDAAGRHVLGSVPERFLFDAHGHDVFVVRPDSPADLLG